MIRKPTSFVCGISDQEDMMRFGANDGENEKGIEGCYDSN